MSRVFYPSVVLLFCFAATLFADHHGEKQYIELRYYYAKTNDGLAEIDAYLEHALVPALNRSGAQNVGVFRPDGGRSDAMRIVVIAHDSIGQFAALPEKLSADATYQAAAKEYMAKNDTTPLARIQSELLYAFDCWPKLKVPKRSTTEERIFELRIYESANERLGNLKVEMFNSGEVPIFLDSGVMPVFMGQAVAGDKMPNLTYLTVYEDQSAKDKAWEAFRAHPDWQVLKKVEKFQGTVSKIHKINLVPTAASQL